MERGRRFVWVSEVNCFIGVIELNDEEIVIVKCI